MERCPMFTTGKLVIDIIKLPRQGLQREVTRIYKQCNGHFSQQLDRSADTNFNCRQSSPSRMLTPIRDSPSNAEPFFPSDVHLFRDWTWVGHN